MGTTIGSRGVLMCPILSSILESCSLSSWPTFETSCALWRMTFQKLAKSTLCLNYQQSSRFGEEEHRACTAHWYQTAMKSLLPGWLSLFHQLQAGVSGCLFLLM